MFSRCKDISCREMMLKLPQTRCFVTYCFEKNGHVVNVAYRTNHKPVTALGYTSHNANHQALFPPPPITLRLKSRA